MDQLTTEFFSLTVSTEIYGVLAMYPNYSIHRQTSTSLLRFSSKLAIPGNRGQLSQRLNVQELWQFRKLD
jgi:hypothetical protein